MKTGNDLVAAALSQLGEKEDNVGSTKFGRWYGLDQQDWCLIFVSWCAHTAGLSQSLIPKLAYCPTALAWFRQRGQLRNQQELPQPGDLAFFDFSRNGVADHVGIVERTENGRLHTIEGNSGNAVRRRSYSLGDRCLLAVAAPDYAANGPRELELALVQGASHRPVTVQSILYQDENYVRLRDLEQLFPVSVDWDAARRQPRLTLAPAAAGAEGGENGNI